MSLLFTVITSRLKVPKPHEISGSDIPYPVILTSAAFNNIYFGLSDYTNPHPKQPYSIVARPTITILHCPFFSPDNPPACTFPWLSVSMATKGRKTRPGLDRALSSRQRRGGGWDPHEAGEYPRGGARKKARHVWRVHQKQYCAPFIDLGLSLAWWCGTWTRLQYHLLYIWPVLHRENHHRVLKHQCDILQRSINQIPTLCRCKPTDGFAAQQISESDPCGWNTHPDFFVPTFLFDFLQKGGGEMDDYSARQVASLDNYCA